MVEIIVYGDSDQSIIMWLHLALYTFSLLLLMGDWNVEYRKYTQRERHRGRSGSSMVFNGSPGYTGP